MARLPVGRAAAEERERAAAEERERAAAEERERAAADERAAAEVQDAATAGRRRGRGGRGRYVLDFEKPAMAALASKQAKVKDGATVAGRGRGRGGSDGAPLLKKRPIATVVDKGKPKAVAVAEKTLNMPLNDLRKPLDANSCTRNTFGCRGEGRHSNLCKTKGASAEVTHATKTWARKTMTEYWDAQNPK